MWLLSVDCRELVSFDSPEAAEEDGGFAALSHVWDKKEQSFQDVRRIQETCAKDGTNPREFVCEKIRRCCELAERHGYKWVWIDTCCIDKTSSAELSEAINSMFRYYALAGICYGYLRDVAPSRPFGCDFTDAGQDWQVRHSIWIKRGWTLQELIAPRFFLFVNSSWEVMGSKADFANLLERCTRIPATVLRLEVSHTAFSIAQRMSWYGKRKTTRLEDEAYCLLGLFDIQMPPLYGEGKKAFRRLQEEIMKQSPDTTLFAWHLASMEAWLFAEQPSSFASECDDIRYTPPEREYARQTSEEEETIVSRGAWAAIANEMSLSLTPHGVLVHVPIVECGGGTYADLYWATSTGRMLLKLKLDHDDPAASSSPRPLYNADYVAWCRIIAGEYEIEQDTARASWHDVLIRDSRPLPRLPGQLLQDSRIPFVPAVPLQLALDTPFRFDERRIRKFVHAMDEQYRLRAASVSIHNAEYQRPGQLDSALSTLYVFQGFTFFQVVIELGQCRKVASPTQLPPPEDRAQAPPRSDSSVWARVCCFDSSPSDFNEKALDRLPAHDCQEDHVSWWPDSKRVFYIPHRKWYEGWSCWSMVTLSFSPCPINKGTLILDASYARWHDLGPSNTHPAVDVSSFVTRPNTSNDGA